MRFSVFEHPDGYTAPAGNHVLYDVAANVAYAGAARVEGRALRWSLGEHDPNGAKLTVDVELHPARDWVVRCDRVDFAAGAVAWRHLHPGPGIRCLLDGELRVDAEGRGRIYEPFQAWFEDAEQPVQAAACPTRATAFVRVLLLPAEWAGKRTIRYLDPADEQRPQERSLTVLLEVPLLR